MEQRRLRPGDVVDDYCPRERRLTDHAIVALIDDTIRQVRCVSCEQEHEYKGARVPASRKKKVSDALHPAEAPALLRGPQDDVSPAAEGSDDAPPPAPALPQLVAPQPEPAVEEPAAPAVPSPQPSAENEAREESALPMIARRRGDALSRHALRPPTEPGDPDPMRPARQLPDFTVRQPGARPGGPGGGAGRGRGGRPRGPGSGPGPFGPMRSGQGAHGGGQGGQRHGRGHGPGQGQGPGFGHRQGGGGTSEGGTGQGGDRPGGGGGRNRRGGRGRGKKG